ncbi:MAG: diaminopimelate epimerase [Burkholderiaceae bacterium]
MLIRFTKMQGAGNDFLVLDETHTPYRLTAAQYRALADRHFGVGADQILSVRPSPGPDIDFEYVIHNADGSEVQQCGNGARCFVRFVRDQGLTSKDLIRVKTQSGVIELRLNPDGEVSVNMGEPVFELQALPFDPLGLSPQPHGDWALWPLALESSAPLLALLSMGNPHAVQIVEDVNAAPVLSQGALIECHPRFAQRVNAGFMQIVDRSHIRLRVFERGAGETLACGTGACAAVVAGIRLGLLDAKVAVQTRGGVLSIEWNGAACAVLMTGPATTVFKGEIEL